MKKLICLMIALALIISSVHASLLAFAAAGESVETVAESLGELNQELGEEGKDTEQIALSRIIVKSVKRPPAYGNALYLPGFEHYHFFQYNSAAEASEALAYYRSLQNVIWAEADQPVSANVHEYQFGDYMLGAPAAKQCIEADFPSAETVKVAVVDSGINFSLFTNFLSYKNYSKTVRCVDSKVNTSTSGSENSANDDHGHGTMCTEIILRNTTENVQITGYKALNSYGSGTTVDIATCIRKAAEDGADVINLSLGGVASETMLEAVEYAYRQGSVVVCASGNDATDCGLYAPACSDKAITVGALDKSGHKANFSNYGKALDFVAPGHNIYFHSSAALGSLIGLGPGEHSGTSFASPYIAAEVALLLSAKPHLSKEQVVEELKSACVDFPTLDYHSGFIQSEEDYGFEYTATKPTSGLLVDTDDKSLFYGFGMPQIDVLLDHIVHEAASLPAPVPSIEPGEYYDSELSVTLEAPEGSTIYYTLDETYPIPTSEVYSSPIPIEDFTSLRAVAYSDGSPRSAPLNAAYTCTYHADESDFTLSDSGSEVTAYAGEHTNIIVPESIQGFTPDTFHLNTGDIYLTGLRLPSSYHTLEIENPEQKTFSYSNKLMILEAAQLQNVHYEKYTPFTRLAVLHCPLLQSFYSSSFLLKELDLPVAKTVFCYNCYNLQRVSIPEATQIESNAFYNCKSLKELYAPKAKSIGSNAFTNCYKLHKLNLEQVANDTDKPSAFAFKNTYFLTELRLPNIRFIDTNFFENSNVSYLYAPALVQAKSLPLNEYETSIDYSDFAFFQNFKIIVSSAFEDCSVVCNRTKKVLSVEHHYHSFLTIYSTPGTYAQSYAAEQGLDFVPLPMLQSEPLEMGYRADGMIEADVLGFRLSYQWYGTNIKDNRLGTALKGETASTMDTSRYHYDYYYCIIHSEDGAFSGEIVTGKSNGALYDVNHDHTVNIGDISLILQYFGQARTEQNQMCDINGDGMIDIADISILTHSQIYGIEI